MTFKLITVSSKLRQTDVHANVLKSVDYKYHSYQRKSTHYTLYALVVRVLQYYYNLGQSGFVYIGEKAVRGHHEHMHK